MLMSPSNTLQKEINIISHFINQKLRLGNINDWVNPVVFFPFHCQFPVDTVTNRHTCGGCKPHRSELLPCWWAVVCSNSLFGGSSQAIGRMLLRPQGIFACFLQLLETACISLLMICFLLFTATASSQLTLPFLYLGFYQIHLHFKNFCNYIGYAQITQVILFHIS